MSEKRVRDGRERVSKTRRERERERERDQEKELNIEGLRETHRETVVCSVTSIKKSEKLTVPGR